MYQHFKEEAAAAASSKTTGREHTNKKMFDSDNLISSDDKISIDNYCAVKERNKYFGFFVFLVFFRFAIFYFGIFGEIYLFLIFRYF